MCWLPRGFRIHSLASVRLLRATFSMTVGRYDQRKNYVEEEANAIGAEHLRADLLPDDAAAQMRSSLSRYIIRVIPQNLILQSQAMKAQ
jgi:hypothetical protein